MDLNNEKMSTTSSTVPRDPFEDFDPFEDSANKQSNNFFDSFEDSANKQFNKVLTYSIVSSIIGLIAIVLIVFFVVRCLRKTAETVSANYYTQTTNNTPAQKQRLQLGMQVISDSKLELATVENFLRAIEREKPIRFSPQQLANFTRNYTTRLGSGGFGVVYKGWFPNGDTVAVKILNRSSDKQVEEQFMAEVSTIGRTYHLNLVRLYGFCFDPLVWALVYEYMPNGSLDSCLFRKEQTMEWEKLHNIAIGTAKGIAYLHEECKHRIIHYDIKPGNVLLDADFSPKVADFGLAKLCSRDRTHVTMAGCRGTPGYAAPELWMPMPITHKCDVYSYGMLLFEIVGRRRNLNVSAKESQEWFPRWVWENFEKGELVGAMEFFGTEEKDREEVKRTVMVALWCAQYQPEARPPMSTVVKMLEGGADILDPPNPFQHLMSSGAAIAAWTDSSNLNSKGETDYTDATTNSSTLNSKAETDHYTDDTPIIFFEKRDDTPIMRRYEIEMAPKSSDSSELERLI